ncbi:hypothetical protein F8B43_3324 [Methylorubrum populi]|uniref:Uncharacterized protein n=1 Tax=Methylorubrum populi TaxID=223967 RepID=A0A833MZE3_9HYPH|nr:hypothetical protein F8B43_3324 [Methylorubrum populi]
MADDPVRTVDPAYALILRCRVAASRNPPGIARDLEDRSKPALRGRHLGMRARVGSPCRGSRPPGQGAARAARSRRA